MKNTFGSAVSLTIFGESHGPAIGAVLDGLAAGLAGDPAYLALRMDRRRARGDGLSTARTEPDEIEFLSGVYNGRTTGTAVTLALRNTNTRSGDYAKTAALLRPGHADYTAFAKYEGWQDARGGVLETIVTGVPAGVGEPWFDSVESELAHLMFSMPAVKGIEFGAGFALARMRGSEANDAFRMRGGRIVTATNRNGGVNGGIANGMPIVLRTAVKPTPSIYKRQDTVDYPARADASLQIAGRHDPCIVPRAAVVQNSLVAFGILDLLTVRYGTLAQKHGLPQPE